MSDLKQILIESVTKFLKYNHILSLRPDSNDNNVKLFIAAENGLETVVSKLLEHGADPNQEEITHEGDATLEEEWGRTPLFMAAQNGHTEVVSKLLEHGATNPNQARTKDGATPLCAAASNGHVEVVAKLLEHDETDPNQADIDGFTPLYMAVLHGRAEVVSKLLEKSTTDPNQVTNFGYTPLYMAAQRGNVKIVTKLLEKSTTKPDLGPINDTPINIASKELYEAKRWRKITLNHKLMEPPEEKTDIEVTKMPQPLLDARAIEVILQNTSAIRLGIDPDVADGVNGGCCGATITRVASDRALEQGVKVGQVISHINGTKITNQVRKDISAIYKSSPTVDLLLWPKENGRVMAEAAEVEGFKYICHILGKETEKRKEQLKGIELLSAAQNGQDDVVKLLLGNHWSPIWGGAPPSFLPHSMEGKWGRRFRMDHFFVRRSTDALPPIDVNQAVGDAGSTPLLMAAQNGHLNVVSILLEHNANPTQTRTLDGVFPLLMAVDNGHDKVVKTLLEHIPAPESANKDNEIERKREETSLQTKMRSQALLRAMEKADIYLEEERAEEIPLRNAKRAVEHPQLNKYKIIITLLLAGGASLDTPLDNEKTVINYLDDKTTDDVITWLNLLEEAWREAQSLA